MADAGTVTIVEKTVSSVKQITWTWTSSAGGAADLQTALPYDGKIECLGTVPNGGGTAPTDLYDIVINDEDGVDVLAAGGQNRSTSAVQAVASYLLGAVAGQKLYMHVTNAGNAKGGVVKLYIR